jgi:rSAM/selenodomain-associated transferase 1
MNTQFLLFAKAPVPGRVKTRLCPPYTPEQAAHLAAAAMHDTIDALSSSPAVRHTIILCGQYSAPARWHVTPQRGDGLADRLVNAYADTALPHAASLLVGMDTPQLTGALLRAASTGLDRYDAVLGPTVDGGWWALGLREPANARVLQRVPMSTGDTYAHTRSALRELGLRVGDLPVLRDVDTAVDVDEVATGYPRTRFARAVRRVLPTSKPVDAATPRQC